LKFLSGAKKVFEVNATERASKKQDRLLKKARAIFKQKSKRNGETQIRIFWLIDLVP